VRAIGPIHGPRLDRDPFGDTVALTGGLQGLGALSGGLRLRCHGLLFLLRVAGAAQRGPDVGGDIRRRIGGIHHEADLEQLADLEDAAQIVAGDVFDQRSAAR
jgi:hypothetical protein